MGKQKALFNWSGGKDSSLALHEVLKGEEWEVCGLLSTFNSSADRLSMHGVRRKLMREQAKQIGLPMFELDFPEQLDMVSYDLHMRTKLEELQTKYGFQHSIFGDIFLEDLRKYREDKLALLELKGVFPLWKKDTTELAQQFIENGFRAVVVCITSPLLSQDFVGRIYDHQFLKDLPEGVDPCGENGEFHTFVFDGPIFKKPVELEIGEKVFKLQKQPYKTKEDQTEVCQPNDNDGFWYVDLLGK